MKKFNKMLSVLLSLVMCAAMVSPAFAASFKDLQDAIDGTGGTQIGDTERYGYGSQKDDVWEIEAWQSDRTVNGEADGQTRYVKLNENVEYDAGKDEENKTITISTDITLDLNGKDIDAKEETDSSVITVNESGALTLNDNGGNDPGKITGGVGTNIEIEQEFNNEASSYSYNGGGGVYNRGTFTMNGGAISGNTAGQGGGVCNEDGGTFTMNGGAISGNWGWNGGGVYNSPRNSSDTDGGTFTMNGGVISDNEAVRGGGVYDCGTFTMNGGAITGNTVSTGFRGGGGIYYNHLGYRIVKSAINGGAIWKNNGNGGNEISNVFDGTRLGITWNDPAQKDCAHDEIVETTAEDGTKTYTCSACGMSYSESDTQGVWDKSDATCMEEGSISYTAGARSAAYTIPADPDNHVKTEVRGAEEATYDKDGYTGDTYCLDCGELIEKGEAIPRLTRPTDNNNPDNNNPDNNNPDNNNPDNNNPGDDDNNPGDDNNNPGNNQPGNNQPGNNDNQPGSNNPDSNDNQSSGGDNNNPGNNQPGNNQPGNNQPGDNNPDNNNPGNNDNQPSGGNGGGENNAPVTPAETEVIDGPDVPLAEAPADGTEVIEDADVPLAELPEEPVEGPAVEVAEEPAQALEVIEDGAVPLSGVPQTGEASTALWLAAVLIAGMGLVYVNTGKRRQNAR